MKLANIHFIRQLDTFESSENIPKDVRDAIKTHWEQFVHNNPSYHFGRNNIPFSHQALEELIYCWAGSDFAAQQCIQHPQWLTEILANHPHLNELAFTHSERLQQALKSVNTEKDLIQCLRQYRNKEMLRIIWLDLNRRVTMQETTADMSALADSCIDCALKWLYNDCCQQMGTPYGVTSTNVATPQQMVVLGMGKLGAQDLNLSSDIDLIFTYPCQGETRHCKKMVSNQEFFIRLGQRLIKTLDYQSADGFVFRVDMRLRPYGSSGSLAMSFAAMEQYYQDQGRDWERYAMLKARAVAGDITAGKHLLNQLRPFVYRRYIDFSSIGALREMKRRIRSTIKRKKMKNNIKLGPGGIRELEFIIQAVQLIHGGRDRSLQERNLLTVLATLSNNHYFSSKEAHELQEAYIFLRNLEHALQAIADQQTQDLPQNKKIRARVSFSMRKKNWSELITTLKEHSKRVEAYFDAIIADPETEDHKNSNEEHWEALWFNQLSKEEEQQLMHSEGFKNIETSWKRLISLRDGKAVTRVRRQSRERLDKFMPHMLSVATTSSEPDTFLLRILPLVEAVLRRTAYLVLLLENPDTLIHLGKLCIASPWIAEQIARFPSLLDEFLNLGDLYNPPDKESLTDELSQQLAHISNDDLESQMEVLRYFRMTHVLRVVAAQVSGTLPLMKESDYLTWIAEVVLSAVLTIAWRNLTQKYGMPYDIDGNLCNPGFIIVGYGKLGGIEMGPGSDLDLVFLHNGASNKETDGPRAIDSSTFYTRLGQQIIHILTTLTPSGILYEADMRLRPSGSKGLLVNSFAHFKKYQQEDAWTWEHQAMVRARVIAGEADLAKKFQTLRSSILSRERDINELRKNVVKMKQKMQEKFGTRKTSTTQIKKQIFHLKYDSGGIIDIEFLMQFFVLRYSYKYPSLLKWTDNIRISEELELIGLLDAKDAYQLRDAYKTFRLAIHQRVLQSEEAVVKESIAESNREKIMAIWRKHMDPEEDTHINRSTL